MWVWISGLQLLPVLQQRTMITIKRVRFFDWRRSVYLPFAAYNQVMNFGVNLTNTGLKRSTTCGWRCENTDADVASSRLIINEEVQPEVGIWSQDRWLQFPTVWQYEENVSRILPDSLSSILPGRREENDIFQNRLTWSIMYVSRKGWGWKLSSDAEIRIGEARVVDSFPAVPEGRSMRSPALWVGVRMKNASSNMHLSNIMLPFASKEGISGQESCIHIGFRFLPPW